MVKNTNHLILTARSQQFKERIIQYLSKEGQQIPDKQSLLGTSDLIESILGKYKFFSSERPLKEMGQMLLTIPLFTTEISSDLVKDAMESTRTKDLEKWNQKVFGQSMRHLTEEPFRHKTIPRPKEVQLIRAGKNHLF